MQTGEASSLSTDTEARRRRAEAKRLRSFGLLVGGILTLIGSWPALFRHAPARLWLVVPGVVLAAAGAALPAALKHPYRGWMGLAHVLGWINTRILLFVIFYVVLTPIAFVRRRMGKDSMRRRFEPNVDTYGTPSTPRAASHMTEQH
jgi:hypothetical protein